jgi:hypothetical protein
VTNENKELTEADDAQKSGCGETSAEAGGSGRKVQRHPT